MSKNIDIVIPARAGVISPRFRDLVGAEIEQLTGYQQRQFDKGVDEGELYLGTWNEFACAASTEVLGQGVTVVCHGASCKALAEMLAIAAAERI
jgi:hypothetical protein